MKGVQFPVYYGWAKVNKIAKREALVVIFLNDQPGPRIGKDGTDGVSRFMHICYKRLQTEAEQKDAQNFNRIYTVYNIFMDDKRINGSLQKALQANFDADCNNVSEAKRKEIMVKLRESYMQLHPEYREPIGYQLELKFE